MSKYTLKYSRGKAAAQVATFPNGLPNSKCFVQDDDQELKWSLYASQAASGKKGEPRKFLVGENEAMEYSASTHGDTQTPIVRTCRYLVGVVSKKDRTVTLYDADNYALKQRVKRPKYEQEGAVQEEEESQELTEYQKTLQSKRELTQSFGARKNQKYLQNVMESRVDATALAAVSGAVQKQMEEQAAHAPTLKETEAEMAADKPLPPFDLSATEPADVFPYSGLITEVEHEALKQPAKMLASAKAETISSWRAKNTYGHFVISHLASLPRDNPAKKNKMVRSLLYIHHLLTFIKCSRPFINPEDPRLQDIPEPVFNRFLATFAALEKNKDGQEVYMVEPRQKQRAQTYAIALALHIDDFTFDYTPFIQDMKMSAPELKRVLQSMGLKLSGNNAKLVTPVSFAKIDLKRIGK